MQLSEEAIEKFRAIYKKQFGKEISTQKALEDGCALVRLTQLIYRPVRVSDYKKIQEERRIKKDKTAQ